MSVATRRLLTFSRRFVNAHPRYNPSIAVSYRLYSTTAPNPAVPTSAPVPPPAPATSSSGGVAEPKKEAVQEEATKAPEILCEEKGTTVFVTINRPKNLNALNLSMVRALTPLYQSWHAKDPHSMVLIVKGGGEKGKSFCAGGDVKAMYDLGKGWAEGKVKGEDATAFFREEYKLNHLIHSLPQTQVSILDGITMGGGVGLSVHGKFRIATENTLFAMPETAIGFFCDVGGSYFLPRLPPGVGMYLGLTGNKIKAGACLQAGIATHYIPAERLPAVEGALIASEKKDTESVKSILDSFTAKLPPQEGIDMIAVNRCFGPHHRNLESIFASLRTENVTSNSYWARDTFFTLNRVSPTSLKVVFKMLREGAKKESMAECLQMEYRIADLYLRPDGPSKDFFEGVRALLVDKDKQYKWNPELHEQVSDDMVRKFFKNLEPTGGDLKL